MLDISYDMFRVLDDDGRQVADGPELSDEELVGLYRQMLLARSFDEQAIRLHRQGRLGTYPGVSGQEAVQIASTSLLEAGDFMFPYYRDSGSCLGCGMKLKALFMFWMGHTDVDLETAGVNLLPMSILISSQIPQASGMAWASKLKGEDRVTLCGFGDGATSKGDFHEGLNFAAVNRVPLVALCQNNQWAISVPLNKQTASKTIAQKALAYGMEGVRVDGGDALAVYEVTSQAVRRARLGEGPTLIEAFTYRTVPHATSDDPKRYQSPEEMETEQADPLVRLRTFLESQHLWDEGAENQARGEMREEISVAVRAAENEAPPRLERIFDYVYAEPTDSLTRQRRSAQHQAEEE